MATQFISTNKNYKRLYGSPLDPSLVWDDISKLREYLNDPTCYTNMIVGCSGKAYIVVEKNGVKDLEVIGNTSDLIIEEFRENFRTMDEEIQNLKDRVLYLESQLNTPPGETTNGIVPIYGENIVLITEDGNSIIYF